MKAIFTKYLPATDKKPARVKAYIEKYSVTITYYDGMSYAKAVRALVDKHKLNWNVDIMVCGGTPDQKGFVFCFPESTISIPSTEAV